VHAPEGLRAAAAERPGFAPKSRAIFFQGSPVPSRRSTANGSRPKSDVRGRPTRPAKADSGAWA
jgi:hypothetical protein